MKEFIFALALLCLLSGCSTLERPSPEISLVDVTIGEVKLLETELIADVRIQNDSDQPLSLSGAVYRLYLNDIDVGKALSDERIDVPRLGSTTQRVTFHISNLGFVTKIQSLIDAKHFSYRIQAKLFSEQLLGLARTINAVYEGRIEVPQGAPAARSKARSS
jgi:LEA14-like dessication related protein